MKTRFCNEGNNKKMCNRCIIQFIENKELEANLNLLKTRATKKVGHMIPCFKE